MIALFVFVSTILVMNTNAFSAMSGICNAGDAASLAKSGSNPMPGSLSNSLGPSSGWFIRTIPQNWVKGDQLTIEIYRQSGVDTFRGLLLYVNNGQQASQRRVGSFATTPGQTQHLPTTVTRGGTCTGHDATNTLTHTSTSSFTTPARFIWTAPTDRGGDITIKAIVYKSGVFNIISETFSQGSSHPTTSAPTTGSPVTASPATPGPVTSSPITAAPSSYPSTSAPITTTPTTGSPVTGAPTLYPTTSTPLTSSPSTNPSTTGPTSSPITAAPVTANPVSSAPVTSAPSAKTTSPTTTPTTGIPTTSAPLTTAPTKLPSSTPTTTGPSTTPSTSVPSKSPVTTTSVPTSVPATTSPSSNPTANPTTNPSSNPTRNPSSNPTTASPTTSTSAMRTTMTTMNYSATDARSVCGMTLSDLGNFGIQVVTGKNATRAVWRISGPSAKWFAVGFGKVMPNSPALIYTTGLNYFNIGGTKTLASVRKASSNPFTVLSDSNVSGKRTVCLSFDAVSPPMGVDFSGATIDVIYAVGADAALSANGHGSNRASRSVSIRNLASTQNTKRPTPVSDAYRQGIFIVLLTLLLSWSL